MRGKRRDQSQSITVERLKELITYEPDTGIFRWRVSLVRRGGKTKPGDVAGAPSHDGGWRLKLDTIEYVAGRIAFIYMTGRWPVGDVDHKDRNRSNNIWTNLRESTRSQNIANQGFFGNSSGVKGVSYYPNSRLTKKYRARIRVNGTLICLGYYLTADEAHKAYLQGAHEHFGQFARGS